MKATWLLQGSFLFEAKGFRLLIDPYISDFVERKEGLTRLAPPPLPAERLKPSFIYCTHNHIDHLDPLGLPEILKLNPEAKAGGPESVLKKALELGLDKTRFEVLPLGETVEKGPFALTPAKAFHSDPAATGLLIEIEGKLIYLSGDTLFKEELPGLVLNAAKGRAIDFAFICINGKLGNMNAAEALKTVQLLKAKTAIPMHYGLFAENTADPDAFLADCAKAGVKARKLLPGKAATI